MTHEELREILNADIPSPNSPDPSWDYYQVWQSLKGIKHDVDQLITYVSSQEKANQEAESVIKNDVVILLNSLELLASQVQVMGTNL